MFVIGDKQNEMTAETLKPFIQPISNASGGEQKLSIFKNTPFLCITIFTILFSTSILTLEIWNSIRTTELQNEILNLRNKLDEINKRIGFDEFEELDKEFDKDLDNIDFGGDSTDAMGFGELYDNFESMEDLDDYEYDIDDDVEDRINQSDVDADTDDDDDGDGNIDGSGDILVAIPLYSNEITDNNDNNNKERKIRAAASIHGVPVIEESYALRRNRTHTIADAIVANILLSRKLKEPKLNYDWTEKQTELPPAAYLHNQYPKKYQAFHGSPTTYVSPSQIRSSVHHGDGNNDNDDDEDDSIRGNLNQHISRNQPYHRKEISSSSSSSSNSSRSDSSSTLKNDQIYNRRNRVMNTNEDKTKAFRQVILKSDFKRMENLLGQNLALNTPPDAATYPKSYMNRNRRRKNMRAMQKSIEKNTVRHHHRPTIGVQYNADTSRYIEGQHRHYAGNGKLHHSSGKFIDWTPAPWASSFSMDNYFRLDNGVVHVQEKGLYFIYAQIFYHDASDINGYNIKHNSNSFIQCTTTTHSTNHVVKSNTCFTSGITYLQSGDTIHIEAIGSNRSVLFDPSKSFFGLFKFGDFRMNT